MLYQRERLITMKMDLADATGVKDELGVHGIAHTEDQLTDSFHLDRVQGRSCSGRVKRLLVERQMDQPTPSPSHLVAGLSRM